MIHQQTPAMFTFMRRCDYCVSNSVKLIVLISFNMNSTILRVKSGCFFLQFAYCRFRVEYFGTTTVFDKMLVSG